MLHIVLFVTILPIIHNEMSLFISGQIQDIILMNIIPQEILRHHFYLNIRRSMMYFQHNHLLL